MVDDKTVPARLDRMEMAQTNATNSNDATHRRAQEDRDRMQRDIDELKVSQRETHIKLDNGIAEIKSMISEDRIKTSALMGALAFARWVIGIIGGFSGAAVAGVIYWLGQRHG